MPGNREKGAGCGGNEIAELLKTAAPRAAERGQEPQPVCQIKKVIEILRDEFISLSHHPEADYGFIAENRDLMGQWDGAYHCLLALDKDGTDGILIEAEGYGSVRYGAYVSHARDFVERELERTAEYLLKSILVT